MRLFAIISVLLMPLLAIATSLRMEGDRVWLDGGDAPLPKVLDLFEKCGVQVYIDPSLDLDRVTGTWENADVDRVISQLVSPHSYLLDWQLVKGPLGEFYKLASIRIFSAGHESAAKPLSNKQRVLDVVTGTNGVQYLRGEIMVGFADGSTTADLKALLDKLGGTVIEVIDPPGIYRIKLRDGLSVEDALAIAKSMSSVKAVEPNLAYPHLGTDAVPMTGPGEGVNMHLQPGETAVAVFDSGLDPQYANLPFIRGMYNALNPSEPMSDPVGHGTLTTLIASGAITPLGAQSSDVGVPVLSVRVFDKNGMTSSDIIMGAINYTANSGVGIISMSWGSNVNSSFMQAAMNYAASKGIKLYASAGNEPTGTPIYPAGYSSVIAVGGLNPNGTKWVNSNYGSFVKLYEPAIANFNGQTYAGTSISSPYAAFLDASSSK